MPADTKTRQEATVKNRQEPADILPRFRREPAEDPPYEPQTKIFSTLRRLRIDFVPRQITDEKAENKKWGGGAPPLGVFN